MLTKKQIYHHFLKSKSLKSNRILVILACSFVLIGLAFFIYIINNSKIYRNTSHEPPINQLGKLQESNLKPGEIAKRSDQSNSDYNFINIINEELYAEIRKTDHMTNDIHVEINFINKKNNSHVAGNIFESVEYAIKLNHNLLELSNHIDIYSDLSMVIVKNENDFSSYIDRLSKYETYGDSSADTLLPDLEFNLERLKYVRLKLNYYSFELKKIIRGFDNSEDEIDFYLKLGRIDDASDSISNHTASVFEVIKEIQFLNERLEYYAVKR